MGRGQTGLENRGRLYRASPGLSLGIKPTKWGQRPEPQQRGRSGARRLLDASLPGSAAGNHFRGSGPAAREVSAAARRPGSGFGAGRSRRGGGNVEGVGLRRPRPCCSRRRRCSAGPGHTRRAARITSRGAPQEVACRGEFESLGDGRPRLCRRERCSEPGPDPSARCRDLAFPSIRGAWEALGRRNQSGQNSTAEWAPYCCVLPLWSSVSFSVKWAHSLI